MQWLPNLFPVVLTLVALGVTVVDLKASVINSLPADGSWAKYRLVQRDLGNKKIIFSYTGTIIVRSVGRQIVDDVRCRWVEFEFQMEELAGGKSSEVSKQLIPEDELKLGGNAVGEIRKTWIRHNDGATVQEQELPGFADHLMIPSPFTRRPATDEATTLATKNGVLRLDRPVSGMTMFHNDKLNIQTMNVIWTHPDVPFGTSIVHQKMQIHRKLKPMPGNDEGIKTVEIKTVIRELELLEYGDGAVSALPDYE